MRCFYPEIQAGATLRAAVRQTWFGVARTDLAKGKYHPRRVS